MCVELFFLKYGNRIRNCFFVCFFAVLVNLGLILFTVCQTACAADTTAGASHALDEVLLKQTAGLFHQRRTAGFDSVAGYGVECEILMSGFFECFGNSIRKTAAAGKNPAEIGSIVKNILFNVSTQST